MGANYPSGLKEILSRSGESMSYRQIRNEKREEAKLFYKEPPSLIGKILGENFPTEKLCMDNT